MSDHMHHITPPPVRQPNQAPVVPERIEEGEWPDDDEHLREWKWIDAVGDPWEWIGGDIGESGWSWFQLGSHRRKPLRGPWTRWEPVKRTHSTTTQEA